MRILRNIPSFIFSKYFLAGTFFVMWMLFFDRNDIFTTLERNSELREIETAKEYYAAEIEVNKKFLVDLKSNPAAIEKFVREKYLMKRDNEDLFIVQALESQ